MKLIEFRKEEIVILPEVNLKEKLKKKKNEVTTKIKNKQEDMKVKMELHRDINHLVYQWRSVMAHTKTVNELDQTFSLAHIEKKDYGYKCRIYAPDGIDIAELEKLRGYIESGLKCTFIFKLTDFKTMALAQFIKNVNCNDTIFVPQKVKPWECYAGVDPSGEPIIFDMRVATNIFLSGNNGKGKSKCNDHILTSLICSCTRKDIQIFLIQLDKEDLIIYEDADQVMGFADTLEKTDNILDYVIKEMYRRTEIMRPLKKQGLANNVYEYNKHNPNKRFPMILIDVDEFSSLVHETSDSQSIKKLKDKIVTKFIKISQVGRAMGIFYVISIQRPTVDRVHPFIKSQSNVKVAFGVSNLKSSEVSLDNNMAVGLPPRRAVTCVNGEYNLLFTTKLTDEDVLKHIKRYLNPGHETIFEDNKEEDTIDEESTIENCKPMPPPHKTPTGGKVPKNDFSKVEYSKQKALEEFYKKYPNAVPYKESE